MMYLPLPPMKYYLSQKFRKEKRKAWFKRRTLQVPNLMQMSKFSLGSAHVTFGVCTGSSHLSWKPNSVATSSTFKRGLLVTLNRVLVFTICLPSASLPLNDRKILHKIVYFPSFSSFLPSSRRSLLPIPPPSAPTCMLITSSCLFVFDDYSMKSRCT